MKRLEAYRKEWAIVEELRPKYMQDMQNKYVPYEQLELKRLKHMKDTLDELAELLKKNADDHGKAVEQFVDMVVSFQPADDLELWSQNFGPGMPFDMSSFHDYPPDRMAVRSPGPPTTAPSEKAASTVGSQASRRPSIASSSCVAGAQRDRSSSRVRTSAGLSTSASNVYEKPAGAAFPSPRPGGRKSSTASTRNDMKQSFGPTRSPGSPMQKQSSSIETPTVSIVPPPPPPPPPMASSAGAASRSPQVPRGILPQLSRGAASTASGGAKSVRQSTLVTPASVKAPRRETKSSIRLIESSRLDLSETKYFMASYPYVATENDECSALPGDVLRLYARDEASNEWWVVVNMNAPGQPCGNIPKTYVEQLDDDEWQELFDVQHARRHEVLSDWVAQGHNADI